MHYPKILYTIFALILLTSDTILGFGKNKVQYTSLDWSYRTLPHFRLYSHQDLGSLPSIASEWLERDHAALNAGFNYAPSERIPVLLMGSQSIFEQTNVIPDLIPEGVGGFTEMLRNRIVIPFDGNYDNLRHVLHHELVHAFQFGIMFDASQSRVLRMRGAQIPLWFAEGSAEYLSSGWDAESDMFLMDQTIHGDLPLPGPTMDGYMAYKGGQSFLHYLHVSRGDSAFASCLREFRKTRRAEESIEHVYRTSLQRLGEQWQEECRRIYWPEIARHEDLSLRATQLTGTEENPRSWYNMDVRISPDGKHTAWYCDDRDYTQLVIGNESGKILRRISQFSTDGQFESFEPFRSGHSFSPDGQRLAFVTKAEGRNQIRIYDLAKHRTVKTLRLPLSALWQPDWSPDGQNIVFCGVDKGETAVWTCDTAGAHLKRLTHATRSYRTPRFSPDGRSVLFAAKDTCSETIPAERRKGPSWELYLFSFSDSLERQLTASVENERDACFSPDGRRIAFVSDRSGLSNIYVAPIDSMSAARALTDIIGGCQTPDWSRESDRLVFTLFEKGRWDAWRIDSPVSKQLDTLPGLTRWAEHLLSGHEFIRPRKIPLDSLTNKIGRTDHSLQERDSSSASDDLPGIIETPEDSTPIESIDIPSTRPDTLPSSTQTDTPSLQSDTTHISTDSAKKIAVFPPSLSTYTDSIKAQTTITKYRPRFSVDMANIGAAYAGYYGFAGQGAIFLSDLMGDHQIGLAGFISNNIHENSIQLSYVNSHYRTQFGGLFFRSQFGTADWYGKEYQDKNIGGQLAITYPFNMFSRVDLAAFYHRFTREPVIRSGRSFTIDTTREGTTINLLEPSVSLTFDNILWGITGPLNGTRATVKLVVAPALGTQDDAYASFDFDARHYFHLFQKIVLATRLTGGIAESLDDSPTRRRFFVGGNENWLNYYLNIDQYIAHLDGSAYSDMVVPFRGWNYFDLSGTRYAVGNVELRFPFIRAIDIAWPIPFSLQHINGALFADFGNAWDKGETEYGFLPSKCYGGIGYGMRMNLGIFVLRYDRAWQTDWKNWVRAPRNYFSLGAEF